MTGERRQVTKDCGTGNFLILRQRLDFGRERGQSLTPPH